MMSDMSKGAVTQLTPRIRRIVAGNSNIMTGPGTNTYLLGCEQVAVIDPGPVDHEHLDAILNLVGDQLRWIFVTHTHPDHSPGAALLAEKTGAEMVGSVMVDDGHQDESFLVKKNILHEEEFKAPEFTLRAVHTPGHVANHFCFLLEEDRAMFTGDHIMGGSTVVIIPPSGDMADYLASLNRLKSYDIAMLCPGHGEVMTDSQRVVDDLIEHRMMRERKVLAELARNREGTLGTLTPGVYDDVAEELHPVAQISLWAHLIKLEKDGLVSKVSDKHWAFGQEKWIYLAEKSQAKKP